jgi:hypothetical protein
VEDMSKDSLLIVQEFLDIEKTGVRPKGRKVFDLAFARTPAVF